MFYSIEGFAHQLFVVLIVLLISTIATGTCFSFGSRKAANSALGLFLILIVGVQLYYLIFAALHVPSNQFFVFNQRFHRSDCIDSAKGGKRPGESRRDYDVNPCFCNNSTSICRDISTGLVVNGSCPLDGSASCIEILTQREIDPYLSHLRDCEGGQGKQCTKNNPCTPCELDKIMEFGSDRCRSCSSDNRGNCNFVPGEGPYCLDSKHSKLVVPCKTCCTVPQVKILNGTCY